LDEKNDAPAIDESLLDYTLSLSYEERLLQHERSLQLLRELQNARKAIYGESSEPPKDAP
jgi:hypothetical protein